MSAVLSQQSPAQTDVGARLAFQKQLQAVTNKIHATNNIDEIMLEVSADICALFNADRLTIYSMGEDKQSIVSKVKTGLNSFKDLKLPIAEHSIAGYVALAKKTANIKDVYDENELRALQRATCASCRRSTSAPATAPSRCWWRRSWKPARNELIGVIQIINNKAGMPFGALAEEGVGELSQTLAIAFKQRQKPQVAKTKYDYLIADAVLSAGEFELAARQARKKAIDIEQVLIDEFQVKIPAIGAALVQVLRRALRGVQDRPHQAGGPAEEPEARVRRVEPVDADRRRQGRPGRAVPRPGAHPLLAHRLERVPEGAHPLQGHDAEGVQGDARPVLRRGDGRAATWATSSDLLGAMGDDAGEALESSTDEVSAAADNELVKLVNKVIVDAYNQGASDIHIEPYPGQGARPRSASARTARSGPTSRCRRATARRSSRA